MKLYIVKNPDNMIMAIFDKSWKADKFIVEVGHKRWNEGWVLEQLKLNSVDEWILGGSDEYMTKKKILKKRQSKSK
jgi:hypothetical protein